MTPRLRARHRQAAGIVAHAGAWANRREWVSGLVLVGSCAGGRSTMGSDVDLVVLTGTPGRITEHTDWIDDIAPGARLIGTRVWGAVVERRLRCRSGLQVDLAVAAPAWAAVPLDPGTRRVLAGGCRILADPSGLLHCAVDGVRRTG